jgi:hypothetical protein
MRSLPSGAILGWTSLVAEVSVRPIPLKNSVTARDLERGCRVVQRFARSLGEIELGYSPRAGF